MYFNLNIVNFTILINRHFLCQDYSFFSHINFRGKTPNDPVNADMASITIKQPVYVKLTTCFHITMTACGNELSVQKAFVRPGKGKTDILPNTNYSDA